jgi:hypothetical protein
MISNSRSYRRTLLRRPLVCKSIPPVPVPPPEGSYQIDVNAESNVVYDSQPGGASILPWSPDLPEDDPVSIDYAVDNGNLVGPQTIPNGSEEQATWTHDGIPGDHVIKARATFSNGAVAWGQDVIEVIP